MPPVVLGIDTSSSWCSAALSRGSDVFVRRAEVGNAHSDHLLSMVDAVLADASIGLGDCDAIAFSAGPGSFTGLRVACAAAQGLAFGASLPVAAIGTLDAIGHSVLAVEASTRSVLVAQDARMGEVYWALIERVDGRIQAVCGPALADPASLRRTIAARRDGRPIEIGCGNAWAVYGDALTGLARRVVHRAAADAVDVAALGAVAWREGRLLDPGSASPLYVRDDVARTTAQREARTAALAASPAGIAC